MNYYLDNVRILKDKMCNYHYQLNNTLSHIKYISFYHLCNYIHCIFKDKVDINHLKEYNFKNILSNLYYLCIICIHYHIADKYYLICSNMMHK